MNPPAQCGGHTPLLGEIAEGRLDEELHAGAAQRLHETIPPAPVGAFATGQHDRSDLAGRRAEDMWHGEFDDPSNATRPEMVVDDDQLQAEAILHSPARPVKDYF